MIEVLPTSANSDKFHQMEHKPDYNALREEVCVERGWCGGIVNGRVTHVDDFVPESGLVTADQFVDWLFAADGVDAEEDPLKWKPHKQGLKEAFIRHMGSDVVDASLLTWNFD